MALQKKKRFSILKGKYKKNVVKWLNSKNIWISNLNTFLVFTRKNYCFDSLYCFFKKKINRIYSYFFLLYSFFNWINYFVKRRNQKFFLQNFFLNTFFVNLFFNFYDNLVLKYKISLFLKYFKINASKSMHYLFLRFFSKLELSTLLNTINKLLQWFFYFLDYYLFNNFSFYLYVFNNFFFNIKFNFKFLNFIFFFKIFKILAFLDEIIYISFFTNNILITNKVKPDFLKYLNEVYFYMNEQDPSETLKTFLLCMKYLKLKNLKQEIFKNWKQKLFFKKTMISYENYIIFSSKRFLLYPNNFITIIQKNYIKKKKLLFFSYSEGLFLNFDVPSWLIFFVFSSNNSWFFEENITVNLYDDLTYFTFFQEDTLKVFSCINFSNLYSVHLTFFKNKCTTTNFLNQQIFFFKQKNLFLIFKKIYKLRFLFIFLILAVTKHCFNQIWFNPSFIAQSNEHLFKLNYWEQLKHYYFLFKLHSRIFLRKINIYWVFQKLEKKIRLDVIKFFFSVSKNFFFFRNQPASPVFNDSFFWLFLFLKNFFFLYKAFNWRKYKVILKFFKKSTKFSNNVSQFFNYPSMNLNNFLKLKIFYKKKIFKNFSLSFTRLKKKKIFYWKYFSFQNNFFTAYKFFFTYHHNTGFTYYNLYFFNFLSFFKYKISKNFILFFFINFYYKFFILYNFFFLFFNFEYIKLFLKNKQLTNLLKNFFILNLVFFLNF